MTYLVRLNVGGHFQITMEYAGLSELVDGLEIIIIVGFRDLETISKHNKGLRASSRCA